MPRVSEAHLAARREQILSAARTCFLRKGFHSTSMQDVTAEAKLSVGAVYRYFASKNEIVQAIAQDSVKEIGREIDALVHQEPMPPLLEVLESILALLDEQSGPTGGVRMAIQVWSEGLRDPEIAILVEKIFGELRARYVALARRAGTEEPEHVGAVLFAMVPGYVLQRIYLGQTSRADFIAGVSALMR